MNALLEKISGGIRVAWDRIILTDALTDEDVDLLTTVRPIHPERISVIVDHDTPSGTVAVAGKQRKLREFARRNGLAYQYDTGISYHVLLGTEIKAGDIVLSCGSHVAMVGAVGALGFCLRPEDMKIAMETGYFTVPEAKLSAYFLEGSFPAFVSAKDLALTLIRERTLSGQIAVFYAAGFSKGDRTAFLALLAESGAVSAFFAEEEPEEAESICLEGIERLAVLPGDFSHIVPAARIDGLRVSQVFIGGCAGGSIEALRAAAEVWRGKRISKYVRAIVAPATASVYNQASEEGLVEVFLDANALIMNQGCSACWAQSQGRCDGNEIFATTGSINCAGWAGKNHNGIYIVSPEDAARAALTGNLYEN